MNRPTVPTGKESFTIERTSIGYTLISQDGDEKPFIDWSHIQSILERRGFPPTEIDRFALELGHRGTVIIPAISLAKIDDHLG
jgi:hypothetical protein